MKVKDINGGFLQVGKDDLETVIRFDYSHWKVKLMAMCGLKINFLASLNISNVIPGKVLLIIDDFFLQVEFPGIFNIHMLKELIIIIWH